MKFIQLTLAATALLFSSVSSAIIISGSHTTSNGKSVDLQGLEWLSLDHTQNMKRADVEGGFTDTFGATFSASDWRYATRVETEKLLGSLWGGTYDTWSPDNGDGGDWFIKQFGGLNYDTGVGASRVDGTNSLGGWDRTDNSYFFFGEDRDCSISTAISCFGSVGHAEGLSGPDHAVPRNPYNVELGMNELLTFSPTTELGYFNERSGTDMGYNGSNYGFLKSTNRMNLGSLLVRKATVPEPSILALMGVGIAGLGFARRRRKSV